MRWCVLLLCLPALAQTPRELAKELDVAASDQWIDTGIDLRTGDSLQFTTTGSLDLGAGKSAGPQGAQRGFRDLIKSYPVNEAGLGALIGRVGSSDAAVPFLIGSGRQAQIQRAGRLFLSINKTSSDSPNGSFHVKVEFASRGPEASATPTSYKLAEVTTAMIDRIPRRVTDAQGNAGDNTNFVVVGSEEKVIQTFEAAGWVKVDREKKDAVHAHDSFHVYQAGIRGTSHERTDALRTRAGLRFGACGSDPSSRAASSFALVEGSVSKWKGEELWVGAATHDIGFDRDNRNNGVTHKIDPNVDDEREFVGRSLDETGLVAKLSFVIPSQASKDARTATGATFHSDGRLMVVHLIPASAAAALNSDAPDVKFANLFCSVREKENPDTGDWSGCEQFLQTAPQARVDLAPLASKYRVLIVPGFFSACASSIAPAFGDGLDHMRNQHGMTVETWVPPNDSSEANGAAIAQYLRDHMVTDQRKYIVVGYSKGAPDVQIALALHPEAKDAVAAFIAVAGAVGGSLIADLLPAQANNWIDRFKLGKCEGDVATALTSLKKSVRQQFLAAHPNPVVPSYSLPAISDRAHTSKALLEAWQLMSYLSQRQDSQLAYEDAILPGSTVLGTARADHLAVAMPFEKASDSSIRSFADQGHYPRAALLEAMLRFVIGDLEAAK